MKTRYIVSHAGEPGPCRRRAHAPASAVGLFVVEWRRVLKVLKLSAQGLPQSWISLEQAVLHYAADEVRWEVGAQVALFRGGHNAMTGEQSQIGVSSIIGTKGVPNIN